MTAKVTDLTFKEITGKRLNNLSQLQKFDIFLEDQEYWYNIFSTYSISEEIKDNDDYITYHDAEDDDWWENIAYQYYDNDKLWWIIALTNDVVNPFEELTPGEQVKLIDGRWLYQIIKEVKNL